MQTLYRHFDAEGTLLYVGISKNFTNRLDTHRTKAAWFTKITTITVQHYSTRKEVLLAEKEAIQAEKPLYNIIYNLNDRHRHSEHVDVKNAPLVNCDGLIDIIARSTRPPLVIALILIYALQRSKRVDIVRISLQDLQERSNLSKPTVIKALDWLEDNMYVIRVSRQEYKISANLAWKGNQVDWAIELSKLKVDTYAETI